MSKRPLGLFCGLMVLCLAIGVGGVERAPADTLPPIYIDYPLPNLRTGNPIDVVFETPAPLSTMMPGGGGGDNSTPPVCLHIAWDTTVVMPSPSDIALVENDKYGYALPELPPGGHYLKVFWGDSKTHKPVGRVTTVLFFVASS